MEKTSLFCFSLSRFSLFLSLLLLLPLHFLLLSVFPLAHNRPAKECASVCSSSLVSNLTEPVHYILVLCSLSSALAGEFGEHTIIVDVLRSDTEKNVIELSTHPQDTSFSDNLSFYRQVARTGNWQASELGRSYCSMLLARLHRCPINVDFFE